MIVMLGGMSLLLEEDVAFYQEDRDKVWKQRKFWRAVVVDDDYWPPLELVVREGNGLLWEVEICPTTPDQEPSWMSHGESLQEAMEGLWKTLSVFQRRRMIDWNKLRLVGG